MRPGPADTIHLGGGDDGAAGARRGPGRAARGGTGEAHLTAPVLVRDRTTGALVAERVFSEAALRRLYGPGLRAWLKRQVATRGPFNRLYGWLQRRPGGVREFVERLGIDASEAELPLEAYASVDAFFVRRLRPGVRPVDPDPRAIVSPADGRALAFADLGQAARLPVKGAWLDLATLLGDAALAARYAGGSALVVRLAPADYHRTHWAHDGVASPPRRLGGRLHSVHPIALAAGAASFANRRVVTLLDGPCGLAAVVDVGALLVGTIVQGYTPGPVRKGAEKGLFRLGGSTTVLAWEPDRVRLDDDLLAATRAGHESLVRVGSRVGLLRACGVASPSSHG